MKITNNKSVKSVANQFNPCRNSSGFTMIEILLVIAGVILIAALTIPVGIRFFQTQTLDETMAGILETLRRAQNQAIFQKNDRAFGVKFLSDSYVLFQGTSYEEFPSEDESFSLPSGTTTSGINEVVFSKLTGIPNTTGTLTITSGNDSQVININEQGKIEKE